MTVINIKHRHLYLAVVASVAMTAGHDARAQSATAPQGATAPSIEEVLILGRLKSSAQSIIDERMDQPFSADLLGSEQISRAGDSDVAAALQRVPGITLIDDQYVYVRSLGERYASTQLNGAAVPSPELTRNVLPLDVIPTSIVESLKIQKAWSPDLPATFGGGNINIRTESVPEELLLEVSASVGTNTENSGDGLFFPGGDSEGMPEEIRAALDQYAGGSLSVVEIQNRGNVSREDAVQINRDLALSLGRDINMRERSAPLDYGFGLDLGNSWELTQDLSFGAILSVSRDDEFQNKDYSEQSVGAPERNYSDTRRSVNESKELGSLNFGLNYQDEHQVAFNSYLIRNIEDDAIIQRGHNASNEARNGDQYVNYDMRHEERELLVLQALGEHSFGQLNNEVVNDIRADWFYSDSTATTDIPHQARIQGVSRINPETGEPLSTALLSSTSMAGYSFLELEDHVRSRGANVHVPLEFGKVEATVSTGYYYADKTREYYGYTANINATGVTSDVLSGAPGRVLTDANIGNLNNNFNLSMGTGLGTESYLAAQMTDAAYGMVDLTWDYTWRITAGARYESFREALLPLNLLDYSYVQDLYQDLSDEQQKLAHKEDDWYRSVAITYINEGFMGTENFQVRASASQTVVRPDLREKSEVSYLDEDRVRVFGNTSLLSSQIDHVDLRTEWFYSGGENFTISLFYKDLIDPIEQSRRPGSDDNIELTYYNAVSGEVYGIEFEALKDLPAGFFLSSNVTLSESEIISPEGEGYTNIERSMTGHSKYVVNARLGYDSPDNLHSLSAVYNVFGERVYYAGRNNGHDDAFEQPFHSFDLVYSFYPTDAFTVKLKATNLLDEARTYTQVNSSGREVTILERNVGTGASLEVSYSL